MNPIVALGPVPEIHLDSKDRSRIYLKWEVERRLRHWVNLVGVAEAARVCLAGIELMQYFRNGNDGAGGREIIGLAMLLDWWVAAGGTYHVTLTAPIVHC